MSSPIRVIWYTDPHNIWCWGFEPTIRRLEVRYPDAVRIETRQGGLFEDFSPVREQWARMSGGGWKDSVRTFFEAVSSQHRMPMNADAMLDSSDDFNSTWPACTAAKAADIQGPDQGWRYLRRLREAWCLEGRGIHSRAVQAEVAKESNLKVDAFVQALDDGSANEAFQRDRDECQTLGISGFPFPHPAAESRGCPKRIKKTRIAGRLFGTIREAWPSRTATNSRRNGLRRADEKIERGKPSEGLQQPPQRAREDEQARYQARRPARHEDQGHARDPRDDGTVPQVRPRHLVPDQGQGAEGDEQECPDPRDPEHPLRHDGDTERHDTDERRDGPAEHDLRLVRRQS